MTPCQLLGFRMIPKTLITAFFLSKTTFSMPATIAHSVKQQPSRTDSWKDFALSVLQLGTPVEDGDNTSGNTIDLSKVNSSQILPRMINSSPKLGKTVDLPLTILSTSPHHLQHQLDQQESFDQEQLLDQFTSKFNMERSKAEEMLNFLRSGPQCVEAKEETGLTWLDVKPVNKQIASNLAHFGNAFGGPNIQNRAGGKRKESKSAKKNEPSIWFDN